MTVRGVGFSVVFSVIMIGFMRAGVLAGGTGSILGGGTPVSRPKGTSSRFAPADLAVIGGPGSRGVRNAFSHDPILGSLSERAIIGQRMTRSLLAASLWIRIL